MKLARLLLSKKTNLTSFLPHYIVSVGKAAKTVKLCTLVDNKAASMLAMVWYHQSIIKPRAVSKDLVFCDGGVSPGRAVAVFVQSPHCFISYSLSWSFSLGM